jgi:osmotically-inducible protein OsmY
VTPTAATSRTDAAIAQAAANALEWDAAVPDNAIKPTVSNGWVTLNGSVGWQFQMSAAVRAVLYGIKGVTNAIILKPQVSASDVKTKIENAFKRSAEIDAQHVKVETRDGGVILTGTVHSLVEKDEAERAAWAAPGVTRVDDRLMVTP